MKIKILVPCVVDRITYKSGSVVELSDSEGAMKIGEGKAEEYLAPKPKAKAKKAPANKMVEDLETR